MNTPLAVVDSDGEGIVWDIGFVFYAASGLVQSSSSSLSMACAQSSVWYPG